MSRIHCSQCGERGHNKRNIRCPVNKQQTLLRRFTTSVETQIDMTPEIQERITLCKNRLFDAIKELIQLIEFISQPNAHPRSDYIIAVIVRSCIFCDKINQALQCDLADTPLIMHDNLFQYFTQNIYTFNVIMGTMVSSTARLVTSFQNRIFTSTIEELTPTKRTSDYLKEISFVQDLTIDESASSCYCPLCFDDVTAIDVVITNCNHSYCGTCIKEFATVDKDKTKKPNCPMCRTDLTSFKIGNQNVYNEVREHILNL